MKRKTLRWIIVLMGLSMFFLIIFQLYWINSLVIASEGRFKRDILEVLNTVANNLEKQETYETVQKLNYLKAITNNEESPIFSKKSRAKKNQKPANNIQMMQKNNQQFFVFSDTLTDGGFKFVINFSSISTDKLFFKTPSLDSETLMIDQPLVTRDIKIQELESKLTKIFKKYALTFDAVNDLMRPNLSIESRFNPQQLDLLLKKGLERKGINIKYDYGVIKTDNNQFLLLTDNKQALELVESELRTALFPSDLYRNEGILVIDFPDKKEYFLGKIWPALISSVFLVFVILFCFGYSIRTIVHQKKLSEMRSDFINNMTHELKTPISTVSLAVEALNDKDINQNMLRTKYIRVIGEENKRLGDQVEKVLQISAIDRHNYNLKKNLIRMENLVERAIEHIIMQIEQKGGKLILIKKAYNDIVKGDEMHLTNMILNLLDNANKYSPNESHITLRTASDEKDFILFIQDKGMGMTKEQQKHIFEKFYRVSTGNIHDVKGFGLGLAYVQRIIEAHKGQINVESEKDKGSKFLIRIPINNEA